jgi:hypothetical protein
MWLIKKAFKIIMIAAEIAESLGYTITASPQKPKLLVWP